MMEKLSFWAGWLGVLLSVGGLIVLGINPGWRLPVTFMELAALILLIFFFIIHFEAIKAFSALRSTKLGLNSILMVVIFLSILGILNFLASRHSQRLDLSETGRFTLAPQTVKVLKELKREVKITAFTQSQSPNEARIQDLLDSYAHQTHQISHELIDPDKKPAIAKSYGITQYDTLVLKSGKQETHIKGVTEQELTNAIIRVSKDKTRRVLFLKGHGEHRLDNTEKDGYSRAKEALEKQGYNVAALSLLETGQVPENVMVLVIAGPQKPLLHEEKEALSAYSERGGKILALLDPQADTNLDDFLNQWGLRLGPGLIVDTLSRLFGGDFTIPIVNTYPSHEITEGFNLATLFPAAQRITFDSSKTDLEFQPIAKTTPNSWSKTNLTSQDLRFNPNEDIRGPLTIAGIITRKSKEPVIEEATDETTGDSSTDQSEMIVFGDSDFASNTAFNFSGNGDLFLNTINYLAKEKDLIAITPKEHRFAPLLLSRTQGQTLMVISLVGVPAAVFLTGLGIWRHRHRL